MMKRLLAALLCAILVMALLPTTALATDYSSWADAMASPTPLVDDTDTITIDGTTYTYGGDYSTTTLDLINMSHLDNHFVYKAGSGKVLWNPTVTGYNITAGTLTFDNATINVSRDSTDVTAVELPNYPMEVIFKNTNQITANSTSGPAAVFLLSNDGSPVTYTMSAGSTARLIAKAGDSTGTAKVISAQGSAVTIGGSGELILDPQLTGNSDPDKSYAIYTYNRVTISGGSVYELRNETISGITKGTGGIYTGSGVTLSSVTIPQDGTLDFHQLNTTFSIPNGTAVTNNGLLILPTGVGEYKLKDNLITGSSDSVLKVDSNSYRYIGGKWIKDGGDISSAGLNLVSKPEHEVTVYKAGSGTVLWEPTKTGGVITAGTLTFDGATIAVEASEVTAVTVPDFGNGVRVVFKGSNSITASGTTASTVFNCGRGTTFDLMEGSETVLNAENGADYQRKGIYFSTDILDTTLEITGSGKLTVNEVANKENLIAIESKHTEVSMDTHTVALTGGTLAFSGSVSGNVILGGVTIPADTELHLEEAKSITKGTAGAVNNGLLVLKQTAATSTDIAAIKALGLIGSGYVKIGDAYYTNTGEKITMLTNGLDFSTQAPVGNWSPSATLEDDGYAYAYDEAKNSYTITLGNLLIVTKGFTIPIKLPSDGNVTIILADGTTTRLIAESASALHAGSANNDTRIFTHTITGNGKLELENKSNNPTLSTSHNLTIAGGSIAITNTMPYDEDSSKLGILCSFESATTKPTLNIIGGKLSIKTNDRAIQAGGGITLGSGVQIKTPENGGVGPVDSNGNVLIGNGDNDAITYYSIYSTTDEEPVLAQSVVIESANPAPAASDYNDTPSPVTVYNDPSVPNATVWLSGSGLDSNDLLITEREPQGSAYKALLKLADSDDVFSTYNIYLRSGKKSTGSAMHLSFDLNAQYAGQDFTLVHQKADTTYEYFYDTADANGDLTFGPLYELSPFMLVKGRLAQTAFTSLTDAPKTGDSAQTVLLAGAALIVAAALAGTALRKRKMD